MAEFEQLALDPLASPARVLRRHPHDQRRDRLVDRWPAGPVRVGPPRANEAAMPAQDGARGDQAMATQRSRQPPDERGEHGPVRPLQAGSGVGAAQHGDLVPQHEELDVLGADVRPSSRSSPSMCWKIRYNSRNDTAEIMPGRCRSSIAAGQRHVQHSGTPQAATYAGAVGTGAGDQRAEPGPARGRARAARPGRGPAGLLPPAGWALNTVKEALRPRRHRRAVAAPTALRPHPGRPLPRPPAPPAGRRTRRDCCPAP